MIGWKYLRTAALAGILLATHAAAQNKSETVGNELSATDLVLIYAGATQSSFWNSDYFDDYVTWKDPSGTEHWLFDGFLLLEIRDIGPGSAGVAFDPGHKDTHGKVLPAAAKKDWLGLIQYYFSKGHAIDAIEQSVANAARRLGAPPTKRQVVISIPNPIVHKNPIARTGGTTYWGKLKGRTLDFSNDDDRFLACKWYIDRILEEYKKRVYEHVELAGFYWVTEENTETRSLPKRIADYLREKHYGLCWIPYFHAPGFADWREKGFSRAYYQPNYFFSIQVPYAQIKTACQEATEHGMGMEVEFDESALAERGRGSRLRDYMTVFRELGVWANCPLAYYQSGKALWQLKHSGNPEDRALYQEFCEFVSSRPCRTGNQKQQDTPHKP